ncbi:MAG: hypothetical protein WBW32_15890 [Luteibacter sp.]
MMVFRNRRLGGLVLIVLAMILVLLVYGAIPGVTTPTLGQAIWTTSFSQSFANIGPFAIHAHNFGYPSPAAISFGLAGAVPCAWLIRAGLSPADAYTVMVVVWLVIAFAGAMALSLRLGLSRGLAACMGTLWLCMPMVWGHVDYSMLSLGMGLMPAYAWGTLRALDTLDIRGVALLFASALIAAFMDGYTFVMFACASGALIAGALVTRRSAPERRYLLLRVVPVHALAFGMALVMYRMYVRGGDYEVASLEMFRAWGMDVTFALVPSKGEFWLWDHLHLAVARSANTFYGDASVWTTTFAAPLLIAAAVAAWRVRRYAMTWSLLAVAIIALFLSLGPSLKIDSRKLNNDPNDVMMPASAAVAPTGTAYLSMHVPGFRLMRASYRWAALAYLACWMLLVMALGRKPPGRPLVAYLIAGSLVLMFLPHPASALKAGHMYRSMMRSIDTEWVGALRDAHVGPVVAFAPHANDFLAAYAGARLNVATFNAGGDKNVEQAAAKWPTDMSELADPGDPGAATSIAQFLLHGTGDQVVIPYIDMLASAHFWPCAPKSSLDRTSELRAGAVSVACAAEAKADYATTLSALRDSPYFDVDDRTFFSVISLKPAFASTAARQRAQSEMLAAIHYPVDVAADINATHILLRKGWNPVEPVNRWSQAEAKLSLPATQACVESGCKAVIRFIAFAASPDRRVAVSMHMANQPDVSVSTAIADDREHELTLQIPPGERVIVLMVEVPAAASPASLGINSDGRVLGISLRRIDLRP